MKPKARSLSSRSLSVLSVLFVIALLTSACTGSPTPTDKIEPPPGTEDAPATEAPEATEAPPEEQEQVTLKIMNFSQEQAEFYEDLAAEFQKEYPWITLEFEILVEDQHYETVPLMFQSDQAPDIFWWDKATMPELLDQGWIRPLTADDVTADEKAEFLARWPTGSFLEGVNVLDDEIYSFTLQDQRLFKYGYMFMNNEVFAAAGLDPVTDAPMTWNELTEVCQTVMDNTDVHCLAAPLKPAIEMDRLWGALGNSRITLSDSDSTAGAFFDYKNGRYAVDDPGVLEAYEYVKSLFDAGYVIPGVNEKTFCRQAFAEGDAAIYFGGAWMPGAWKTGMGYPDLDFSVGLLPYPDEGPRGGVPTNLAKTKAFVSSQTDHPEDVWLFLEYMTRPDGFYASEFVGRGFGQLAFTDNGKWMTDPHLKKIAELVAANPFVVNVPDHVVKCPAAALSKSMSNAKAIRAMWEWEAMVEALTSGADFAPVAKEIAETKNEMFLQTLEEEAAAGMDISVDCYTFPDWEYDQDYVP